MWALWAKAPVFECSEVFKLCPCTADPGECIDNELVPHIGGKGEFTGGDQWLQGWFPATEEI